MMQKLVGVELPYMRERRYRFGDTLTALCIAAVDIQLSAGLIECRLEDGPVLGIHSMGSVHRGIPTLQAGAR